MLMKGIQMNRSFALSLVVVFAAGSAFAKNEARLLRFPAIHEDKIVLT